MAEIPCLSMRANDVSFLGLIRAASNVKNIDNYCGIFSWDGAPKWYSDYSQNLKNTLHLQNPAEEEQKCLSDLINFGELNYSRFKKKTLVLCSSDVNEVFFQNHSQKLNNYFYLPGEKSISKIRKDISDKGIFFDTLSQKLPEFCPKTVSVKSENCLVKLKDWSIFPCVVKPAKKDLSQSFYRLHKGDKALLIDSYSMLKSTIQNLIKLNYELVVQEFISFDSLRDEIPTYAYFDNHSELKIYCNCIKKYVFPPKFGTALSVEVTCDEQLIEATKKIGDAINWFGPLMIEFVRDTKNNRLLVLEVNTRPWLFHDFYRQIGLDFVPQYLRDLSGGMPKCELQTPNERQLGSVNINLIDLAKLIPDELTESKRRTSWILETLKLSTNEKFYFTHFDNNDSQPYLSAMRDLELLYKIDVDRIENLIKC